MYARERQHDAEVRAILTDLAYMRQRLVAAGLITQSRYCDALIDDVSDTAGVTA